MANLIMPYICTNRKYSQASGVMGFLLPFVLSLLIFSVDRTTAQSVNGSVRLVPGRNSMKGRLEIQLNGLWGTVCDDSFDSRDASVACNQLGLGTRGILIASVSPGPGNGPIWLDEVACQGTEPRLIDCPHPGVGVHDCFHFEDVHIRCHNNTDIDVALRLVGGASNMEGRLEVRYSGEWGTVCDNGFDDAAATVACAHLGFSTPGAVSRGTGLIWLDEVNCNGTEQKITECGHDGWGIHDCTHPEDVRVRCGDEARTTSPPISTTPTQVTEMTAAGSSITTTSTASSVVTENDGHRDATVTPMTRMGSSTPTSQTWFAVGLTLTICALIASIVINICLCLRLKRTKEKDNIEPEAPPAQHDQPCCDEEDYENDPNYEELC